MPRRILVLLVSLVLVAGTAGWAFTRGDAEPRQNRQPEARASTPAEVAPEPGVEAAVTIDPRATAAAMDVLADDGTAADAAFAAAAVLSVVEPYYSNIIGGETSAIHHDAETGETRSLEAVGVVGEDFSLDSYRGGQPFGLDQVITPGAWSGWTLLLSERGQLGLDRLLEPAIGLAADGAEATAELSRQVRIALDTNAINGPARAIYAAPGGTPDGEGDVVVQDDFAATLRSLAEAYATAGERAEGLQAARDLVYEGALAERILAAARDGGATFTAADLAATEAVLRDTITLEHAGVTVHQNPPTSQGVTMLTALNTLAAADLGPDDADDPDTAHLVIEALKLAMADREAYVGDPEFTDVPVEELLDPAYGARQLERIDLDSSIDAPISGGLDNTTTLQVVDRTGDAVTVTTSTGYQLVQAGDTGIMLNNRLRYMTATDPDSPNFLEPGKKVRYTGNPWMVTDDDGVRYLGGTIGGDTQAQVQAQHVLGVLDLGLSPEEAIARYRFVTQNTPGSIAPHGTPNQVRVEQSTPDAIVRSLRERGQNVSLQSGSGPFGAGTMIGIAPDRLSAELATEPRVPTSTGEARTPEEQ